MNSKNFTAFLVLVIVMIAVITLNLQGDGIEFNKKGEPIVQPPLDSMDYSLKVLEEKIVIELSTNLSEEYNGRQLSVYAYDDEGRLFAILKRVTNGRIEIGKNETPAFEVKFKESEVVSVGKPEGSETKTLYGILSDAKESGLNYGLGRCLLGRPCTRTCPVQAVHLVRDDSPEGNGRIIPTINYDKCILDGRCPTVCPTNLITYDEN